MCQVVASKKKKKKKRKCMLKRSAAQLDIFPSHSRQLGHGQDHLVPDWEKSLVSTQRGFSYSLDYFGNIHETMTSVVRQFSSKLSHILSFCLWRWQIMHCGWIPLATEMERGLTGKYFVWVLFVLLQKTDFDTF